MFFRNQVMYGAAAALTALFASVALSERPGEAPRHGDEERSDSKTGKLNLK